jgi:hypothetical protein
MTAQRSKRSPAFQKSRASYLFAHRRSDQTYFLMINLWQRLQRTRALTKQLHFGQRFNFRAILRFVRGRITISNHSCQFGPMSGGKERGKLAKAAANLKRTSGIKNQRSQTGGVCLPAFEPCGKFRLLVSPTADRMRPA